MKTVRTSCACVCVCVYILYYSRTHIVVWNDAVDQLAGVFAGGGDVRLCYIRRAGSLSVCVCVCEKASGSVGGGVKVRGERRRWFFLENNNNIIYI